MSIKKILFLVTTVVLCCLPPVTSALSLGDLHASSRQGEPLQAEVNLVSFNPKTRLEQITARIPPLAMFQRFNLRRDAFLDRIRLTSVQTGNGFQIKLASAGVMPSKPVDLLLEIEINGERTLKQYRLALPAKRAALPVKRAQPLPVAVPANVLSKKVPQHVNFGQSNKAAQQNNAPKRAVPQKQAVAQNTRALPLPVAKPAQVRKPPVRKSVPRKPVAKRPVTNRAVTKKTVTRKPAVKTARQPRQHHKVAKAARPSAQKPVWSGDSDVQANVPAAQPVRKAYDASAPYIDDDWQATQHYYQDYQLPTSVNNAATVNAGQLGGQPVYEDNYISFVPTPQPVATHYTVKRGDTLFKIAARHKPGDVSTDQMLFALYKQNSAQLPSVEKIDKLYVGQRLKLPAPNEVRAFSRAQGRKFKQSYLEKHRQRLVKKREAAEKARLATEKAEQLAKARQLAKTKPASSVSKTRTGTSANPIAKTSVAKTTSLPVAKSVARTHKPVNSAQQITGKPVVAGANKQAFNPGDHQLTLLEGRLRKVKRLLEIEKQKHTTTKQVIKEKNRLIQRKDNMIQELQVAGVKGNKAQSDAFTPATPLKRPEPASKTVAKTRSADIRTTKSANAASGVNTKVKQSTTTAALGVAATTPATSAASKLGVAGTSGSAESLAAANNTAQLSADPLKGLAVFWADTLAVIKDFFASYPVLSVLLPVIALLGLLMLLFKPKRSKRAKHAAYNNEALNQSSHAATEPAIDYVSPVRSQPQTNIPPHKASVQPDPLNREATAAEGAVSATSSALTAVDPNALSMNGHGPQTVVINISAPARINIDMATEGKELDLLRQQTDKLKESLRSLENSSRLLSDLNTAS